MFKVNGKRPVKKLSAGAHNTVWAIDDETVAKQFELGEPQAQRELLALQKAPRLLPKPDQVVPSDGFEFDLLLMERLTVMDKRNFDHEVRAAMLGVFETELFSLHDAGWAHGDIRRIADQGGTWDNVIWTPSGIRLIDAGNAVFGDEPTFAETRRRDLQDLKMFHRWALQD